MDEVNDPTVFDLRRFKVGGWDSTKIKTKTNGKWIYIYEGDTNQLINLPEPIHFEKRYKPPNYVRHEPQRVQSSFDTRLFERSIESPTTRKAPLSFAPPNHSNKLVAPVVYSQFCQSKRLLGIRTAKVSPRKKLLERANTSMERNKFSQSAPLQEDNTLSPFITHYAAAKIMPSKSANVTQKND